MIYNTKSATMAKHALFIVCMMTLSVRGAMAVTCGAADSTQPIVVGAPYTCDCPAGTGKILAVSIGTALPTPITNLAYSANGFTAGTVTTLTIAASTQNTNGPVAAAVAAMCTDVWPGFAFTAVAGSITTLTSKLTACSGANTFCPGDVGLLTGGAALTSDTALSYTIPSAYANTAAWISAATVGGGASSDSPIPVPCPANTAAASAGTAVSICLVSNGYYVSTAFTVNGRSVSGTFAATQCGAGSVCLNTGTAASATQTPTTCAGNSGGVSSFICPAGTYSANLNSHTGASLVLADVANEVVCGTNMQAMSDATACQSA